MATGEDLGGDYQIHASGVVVAMIQQVQRQAEREGRGVQVLAALKHIHQRLQQDPHNLGEPFYRLAALKLQVRTCVVRPLVVDFAVHEDRPLVLIKGVQLLSERES